MEFKRSLTYSRDKKYVVK